MAFNINNFRAGLRYGGARSSLFEVRVMNPVDSSADQNFSLLCSAASLPGMTVNEEVVSYFGRETKHAGNRTYDDWDVTIINDEDFLVRNAMEAWNNSINTPISNVRNIGDGSSEAYRRDALVTQYSKTGEELRTYKLVNAFPKTLGAIELNWEGMTIETFPVTFSYDYWIVDDGGRTGTGGTQ